MLDLLYFVTLALEFIISLRFPKYVPTYISSLSLPQVSKNILNVSPRNDDSCAVEFFGCAFKEEETFRSLAKRMKSVSLQTTLLQQQPRFYELIGSEFDKHTADYMVSFTYCF